VGDISIPVVEALHSIRHANIITLCFYRTGVIAVRSFTLRK